MRTRLAGLLFAVVTAAGCELPWELLETNSLTARLVSVTTVGEDVWIGSDEGRVLWLADNTDEFERVLTLNANGEELGKAPIQGFATGSDGDLYAWVSNQLLRRTSGSFSTVAPPADVQTRLLARSWAPRAVQADGDRMFVATRVGDGPGARSFLLEGTPLTAWRKATFSTGDDEDVTWLARAPDGTLWAGDGSADARTLYRLNGDVFEEQSNAAVADARKVAVSGSRLFMLNATGVRTVDVSEPGRIIDDLTVTGRFDDICSLPDGRVVLVGDPTLFSFTLWIFENDRWGSVNTGTRQTLHAVHCAPDGSILAAGDSGMVIRSR